MPRKDLRLMVKGLIAGIWTLSLAFVLLFRRVAARQHVEFASNRTALSTFQLCMVTI